MMARDTRKPHIGFTSQDGNLSTESRYITLHELIENHYWLLTRKKGTIFVSIVKSGVIFHNTQKKIAVGTEASFYRQGVLSLRLLEDTIKDKFAMHPSIA